jgi:hypothetical protein
MQSQIPNGSPSFVWSPCWNRRRRQTNRQRRRLLATHVAVTTAQAGALERAPRRPVFRLTGNGATEEELRALMDQCRAKRVLSNRESARHSHSCSVLTGMATSPVAPWTSARPREAELGRGHQGHGHGRGRDLASAAWSILGSSTSNLSA